MSEKVGSYAMRARRRGSGLLSASHLVLAVIMLTVTGGVDVARADDGALVATRRFADATIGFDLGGNYRNLTLSISGPNGFHVSAQSERTAPVINLRKFGKVEDGLYNFQLTGSTTKRVEYRSTLNDGRGEDARKAAFEGAQLGGTFVVKGGVIKQFRDEEER
ncbi:hypothetical protein [Breoghania sp.]|uniref:hypothetical protein n=1 Tax=Breoghania sp. TaxID=2065378 RepID=UPI0029CAA5D4|nr:hypothetical protein [Breoghania sp.]